MPSEVNTTSTSLDITSSTAASLLKMNPKRLSTTDHYAKGKPTTKRSRQSTSKQGTSAVSTFAVSIHPATKITSMVTRSMKNSQEETHLQFIFRSMPIGVWHRILDFIPVSHVPALSLSSRSMLRICQTWPVWKDFCEANDLGKPKGRSDQSYMTFVCTESFYMCDQCHSRTTGMKPFQPQEIPLPVHHFGDRAHVWRLCLECRVEYYERFSPPMLTIDPRKVATADWIHRNLCLSEKDLGDGLEYFYEPDQDLFADCDGFYEDQEKIFRGGYTSTSGLKLYNKAKAMEFAMEKFGGTVGLNAVRKQIALLVEQDYDLRKHRYSQLCWSNIFKKH